MVGLYNSISDFIEENNLYRAANRLFGEGYEPELDVERAKQLCEDHSGDQYKVIPNDNNGNMNSDFEFEVDWA